MLITMLLRWLSDVFPVGNWCGKDKYAAPQKVDTERWKTDGK